MEASHLALGNLIKTIQIFSKFQEWNMTGTLPRKVPWYENLVEYYSNI